ncbi:MAG: hypothetical protein AAFZ38_10590 [Myxococcota bacterium]
MATAAEKMMRTGDAVYVRFGYHTVPALIVEDRGRIGAKGRHLFRIRLVGEDSELSRELELEVPKSALSLEPTPSGGIA